MIIGLDYDGTYTEDPILWRAFITGAQLRDHDIYIVTFRGDDTPVEDEWLDKNIPIIYTAAHAKKPWMENLGINIDVWIDDNPDLIYSVENAWTPEERERWKQEYFENQKVV